jgi:1,4-dihydroxy-2-naphthoate octaprenyltransferase
MVDLLGSTAFTYTATACMLATAVAIPFVFDKLKYAGGQLGFGELASIIWFGFTLALLSYHAEQWLVGASMWIKLTFAIINVFLATSLLYIKVLNPMQESVKKSE